ncbi:hypothetical protein BWR17_19560 (plasmid) [Phaeobacter inhibens]|nr:hypothetical protein BWR17_19560 [Phaeobacter inhibens]
MTMPNIRLNFFQPDAVANYRKLFGNVSCKMLFLIQVHVLIDGITQPIDFKHIWLICDFCVLRKYWVSFREFIPRCLVLLTPLYLKTFRQQRRTSLDTDTCNTIEITEVIRAAIAKDAILSPQMAKVDAMIVASADKEIDTTDDETAKKLQCGGRILLVQLWPQSSRLSLVAVRLLSHHNLGMPWSATKAEENRILREEREVLKKAAIFFAGQKQ